MGRFRKGILGGFSGKVGNIIGGSWKGITYMRSLSEITKRPPSEKQLMQRARFAYGVSFLQPLHPVIRVGYRNQADQKSPINAALAHVLKKVVQGDYPAYQIGYSQFEMAKGLLPVTKTHQIQLVDDHIEFSWTDSSNTQTEHGDNQALLLAMGEGIYPAYSIDEYKRNELSAQLPLPAGASGTSVYCYLAFASDKNASVSNSQYLGSVVLP